MYTFLAEFESNHGSKWAVEFDQDWEVVACSLNGNLLTRDWYGLRADIILANAIKRCDMPLLDAEASRSEEEDIDFINAEC